MDNYISIYLFFGDRAKVVEGRSNVYMTLLLRYQ